MLVFPVYAMFVWYLCWRFRRRWEGFAAVLLGGAGVVGTGLLHVKIRDWTGGAIDIENAQILLYTYGVLVLGMGVFFVVMPTSFRNRRAERGQCVACGYDVRALGAGDRCPECGRELSKPAERFDVAGAQRAKWSKPARAVAAPASSARSSALLLDRAGRDTRESRSAADHTPHDAQ